MPKTSSTWSAGDQITATRLNQVNTDLADLYANGSDRLRVSRAVSGTALRIDIGAGSYYIGSTQGIYAGGTDIVVTNSVTNYVMIDSSGTIVISTSAFTIGNGKLATVVCSGGVVTTITSYTDVVFGGAAMDITALTVDTNPNRATDKLISYDASAGVNKAVYMEAMLKTQTFSGTAGESITAGDALYIDINTSVYKTVRKCSAVAQLGSITGLDSGTHTGFFTQCGYLSDNVAVTAYKKSADNKVYASIATFTRATPSVGTESSAISGALEASGGFSMCVLSATLFIIAYKLATDDKLYAVACTVSGSTITVGTPVKMYDTEQIITGNGEPSSCCKVSATSFAAGFVSATSSDPLCVVGTISGTTITAGTAVAFKATTSDGPVLLEYISDGVIAGAYNDGSVSYIRTATVSGSTISMLTESASITGLTTFRDQLIFVETGQLLLVDVSTSSTTRIVAVNIANQSTWTHAVAVNTFYITNDYATAGEGSMVYLGDRKFARVTQKTLGTDARVRIMEFGQNDMKILFDTTVAGTMTMMSACKLTTTQDKLIFVYESGADMRYSLYWNTEKQFCGVAWENASAAAAVQVVFGGVATISGLTAGLPYFVGDAGLLATSGTYRAGVALTTGTLLVN